MTTQNDGILVFFPAVLFTHTGFCVRDRFAIVMDLFQILVYFLVYSCIVIEERIPEKVVGCFRRGEVG